MFSAFPRVAPSTFVLAVFTLSSDFVNNTLRCKSVAGISNTKVPTCESTAVSFPPFKDALNN